jgi:hypothetical protein
MGGNTPVLVRLSGYSDKCLTIYLYGVIACKSSCDTLTLVIRMVVSNLCNHIGRVDNDLREVYGWVP